MKGVTLTYQSLGLCPCGQAIGVNMKVASVAHAEPQCAAFREKNVLEFLRYVRASHGCICEGEANHDPGCPLKGKAS